MRTDSVLRHLLSDDESLSSYYKGYPVSLTDIRRRMLLKERGENRTIPDQHYRLVQENTFLGLNDTGEVLRKGLYRLAAGRLSMTGKRIFVQQEKQNDWQELITQLPPLVLQAGYLHIEEPLTDFSQPVLQRYFNEVILPNFRNTALPHPYIAQLEQYITDQEGLHDLHMHLNGTTETDVTWQSFLSHPDECYKELGKVFSVPKVREQLEQESSLLSPLKFYHLLKIAARIRLVLFDLLFGLNKNKYNGKSDAAIMLMIIHAEDWPGASGNPFSAIVSGETDYPYQMAVEALMQVMIFRHLSFYSDGIGAKLFHFYLLILGLCNRLLVQQTHQYGFEQFQKHTLNGLREFAEKAYLDRFLQLHGNEFRNIAFLEGRFSPKKTADENIALLNAIFRGWNHLHAAIGKMLLAEPQGKHHIVQAPEIRLTAHFIKRADAGRPDPDIRHRALRIETWNKALVLKLMKKNYPSFSRRVTGIDAASSEFDAPPEVFAPSFRMLRRAGWANFTYHAGEDFHHLISGLRAVYEAAYFTEMTAGNRIGHATATGLSVTQWVGALGKHMLIRKGEWLDNLIFTYQLIAAGEIPALRANIPALAHEIQGLSHQIYGKYYSIRALEDAWLLRKYCPFMLFSATPEEAARQNAYNAEEYAEIKRILPAAESLEIIRCYHSRAFRQAQDDIIQISITGIFSPEDMELLQLAVLKFLHRKEVVIETLPTSNVRIGHHRDYSTYHLWNWIRWEKEGHAIPPIVVGTDDTGIFATNIYNEYANIYCYLTGGGKMTHTAAMQVIERLDQNGRIYRFDQVPG